MLHNNIGLRMKKTLAFSKPKVTSRASPLKALGFALAPNRSLFLAPNHWSPGGIMCACVTFFLRALMSNVFSHV